MKGVQSHLLNHLRTHRGAWRTWREIADAVWGDDPEGGPTNTAACVNLAAAALRRRGFAIEHRHGFGYRVPA